MDKLYTPWRELYTTQMKDKKDKEELRNKCVFCHQLDQNDDDAFFILKRLKHVYIAFNIYPYNAGHVMVLPLAHKGKLEELTPDERCELIEATNFAIIALEQELKPHGFNVGLNLGKAGGGGIPSHLHMHILPRWEGDSNFLPLLCDTKTISLDLRKLFDRLKPRFRE